MKKSSKTLGLGLALLLLLLGCQEPKSKPVAPKTSRVTTLPYYNEATFTPRWLSPNSYELDGFHQISDFQLLNQDGDTITPQTFAGKIYVTDFFFTTCPGICPKMTTNMALLQEEYMSDDEVFLLSHSVTPERDSVSVLKDFADFKDIKSPKWNLVTGDREEIYRLGRKDYFVEEDLGLKKESTDFLHTENFVLVDKQRHIRGIYNGLNANDISQLIADIETLKKEG